MALEHASLATSVIIAVRNGELFLRDAIESVLNGVRRPDEIVVVDGHSTDDTATIAESYPEIQYVLQDGTGIAAAYNQGVRVAQFELLAFLSCDDLWEPSKLQMQVNYLSNNPTLDFCITKVRHFLNPGSRVPSGFRPELLEQDRVAYIMETLLARRRVFDKVGLFDESFEVAEDVDWFARARDAHDVHSGVVREVLVRKRVHDDNASLNAEANNALLLKALRASIERKRTGGKD